MQNKDCERRVSNLSKMVAFSMVISVHVCLCLLDKGEIFAFMDLSGEGVGLIARSNCEEAESIHRLLLL